MGNNEKHSQERAAWERGYREAALDVFCFLTGNPQALDIGVEHFNMLQAMLKQVQQLTPENLREVEEVV